MREGVPLGAGLFRHRPLDWLLRRPSVERWARTALITPRPAHSMWEARFGQWRLRRPVWWWRRFGFFSGVRTRGLWRRRSEARGEMLRALGVLPAADRAGGGVGAASVSRRQRRAVEAAAAGVAAAQRRRAVEAAAGVTAGAAAGSDSDSDDSIDGLGFLAAVLEGDS